ncbi:MAG: hypothetical protein K2N67_02695 [Mucispirillum sp.]|nr:hypothetical protein [Mucispirillum sp.]
MKKFLLLLFLGTMSLFALTACDDSSDKTILPTAPDMSEPDTLTGTYSITFFATIPDVAFGIMTTDCQKAIDLNIFTYGENVIGKTTCNPDTYDYSNDNAEAFQGKLRARIYGQQAAIRYNETEGLVIETKLQLWQGMLEMSPKDVYQYTKYGTVSGASITENGINLDNGVLGVSGRNLQKLSDNPNSEFNVTKLDDGSLKVSLNLKDKSTDYGKVDSLTVVILQKVSDIPVTIDPDSLFVTVTGNTAADNAYAKFVPNPQSAE